MWITTLGFMKANLRKMINGFEIFPQRKYVLYIIVVMFAQVNNKMAELTLVLCLVGLFFCHITKNSDSREDYLKYYQR